VLVEVLPGFVVLRPLERLFRLRTSVSKTVLRRLLLGPTPLGLFARGAKIDNGSHELDGNRILLLWAILARMVCSYYAVTLT
jgi:hypothetical protein